MNNLKFILWKLGWEPLPTRSLLAAKELDLSNICQRCQGDEEAASHVFFHCPFAPIVWGNSDAASQCLL